MEKNNPEKYMAVFHCCTSIAETGYERWDEEFHIIRAHSLEEALDKASERAQAQATEFVNAEGHIVKVYPAQVADVQPFIFQDEEEAVYIRNFANGRPTNVNDIDVAGHYVALILQVARNTVTGNILYSEETYLIYGKTEADARAQAQERADTTFSATNEAGEVIDYKRKLIEFVWMETAPKYGNLHSRYFRDKAAYDAFIGAVNSEMLERKVP